MSPTTRAHQNLPFVSREPRVFGRGFCHGCVVHQRFGRDHAEGDAKPVHEDAANAIAAEEVQPLVGQKVDQFLSAQAFHCNGLLFLTTRHYTHSAERVGEGNPFQRVVGQKQLLLFLVVDKELAAEEVTQLGGVGREEAEDRIVGLAALE